MLCRYCSTCCILSDADSQYSEEESTVVCGRLLFPRTARKEKERCHFPVLQKPDRGSNRLTFRAGWAHYPSAFTHFLSAWARMHTRKLTHTLSRMHPTLHLARSLSCQHCRTVYCYCGNQTAGLQCLSSCWDRSLSASASLMPLSHMHRVTQTSSAYSIAVYISVYWENHNEWKTWKDI